MYSGTVLGIYCSTTLKLKFPKKIGASFDAPSSEGINYDNLKEMMSLID
jgi:hypothetical protein